MVEAAKKASVQRAITVLLWRDALLHWVFPGILVASITGTALLGAFNEISTITGITVLGWLLLFAAAYFLFGKALILPGSKTRFWLTALFGIGWLAVMLSHFYFAVRVGHELFHGLLEPGKPEVTLSLGETGTVYDLLVEGQFVPSARKSETEARYQLALFQDGKKLEDLDGELSTQRVRQRLGRRGSLTTYQLRNHFLHRLRSPGSGSYQLRIVHLDPQLANTMSVELYRDVYPEKTFWGLSALLLIGAYFAEIAYAEETIPFLIVTASGVVFALVFPELMVPPHSYRDLLGALMIAALSGPVVGISLNFAANRLARRTGLNHSGAT